MVVVSFVAEQSARWAADRVERDFSGAVEVGVGGGSRR